MHTLCFPSFVIYTERVTHALQIFIMKLGRVTRVTRVTDIKVLYSLIHCVTRVTRVTRTKTNIIYTDYAVTRA